MAAEGPGSHEWASPAVLLERAREKGRDADEHRRGDLAQRSARLGDRRESGRLADGDRGARRNSELHFSDESPRLAAAARRPMPETVGQLDAYFAGDRQAFDLDLDLRGSPLQKLVWAQLLEIPTARR